MSIMRETDGDDEELNAWTFVAAVLSTVLAVIMGIVWLNPRQRCLAEVRAKPAEVNQCEQDQNQDEQEQNQDEQKLNQNDHQEEPGDTGATIADDEEPWLTSNSRFYLYCPYAEADQVRQRGARWDQTLQLWFVPVGFDISKFLAWTNPQDIAYVTETGTSPRPPPAPQHNNRWSEAQQQTNRPYHEQVAMALQAAGMMRCARCGSEGMERRMSEGSNQYRLRIKCTICREVVTNPKVQ